jgi:hypothetical protein
MAKLSRNQLKGLVKECLIELLAEGLLSESDRPKKRQQSVMAEQATHNTEFENNISSTVNELTSDPMLASIFDDTARTTLQEQLGAESAGPMATGGDRASKAMANSDPDEVFGDAANRWASLAFAEKKNQ